MDLNARYMVAASRLAALADPRGWTPRDLTDVFALVTPSMSPEEWAQRIQRIEGAVASGPPADEDSGMAVEDGIPFPSRPPVEGDPDPVTTDTMNKLLGGQMQDLIRAGIVSVKEVKPEEANAG